MNLRLQQWKRWRDSVLLHTVGTRCATPSMLHETSMACLSVIAGQGTAIVDGIVRPLALGDQIPVCAGAFYALACTGKGPLIVAETLAGPGTSIAPQSEPARLTA